LEFGDVGFYGGRKTDPHLALGQNRAQARGGRQVLSPLHCPTLLNYESTRERLGEREILWENDVLRHLFAQCFLVPLNFHEC